MYCIELQEKQSHIDAIAKTIHDKNTIIQSLKESHQRKIEGKCCLKSKCIGTIFYVLY